MFPSKTSREKNLETSPRTRGDVPVPFTPPCGDLQSLYQKSSRSTVSGAFLVLCSTSATFPSAGTVPNAKNPRSGVALSDTPPGAKLHMPPETPEKPLERFFSCRWPKSRASGKSLSYAPSGAEKGYVQNMPPGASCLSGVAGVWRQGRRPAAARRLGELELHGNF